MAKETPATGEIITDDVLRWSGATNTRIYQGDADPTQTWYQMLAGGTSAIDAYEALEEKDDMVGASLETRKDGVLKCETTILPATDDAAGTRWADFAIDVFKNIPDFDNTLYELLDAIGKGVAMVEVIWERAGNEIRVASLKPRPQQIFAFGQVGLPQTGPLLLTQYRGAAGQALPERKFLVHSFRPHAGNRWGSPLIRKVYWLSWFKRQDVRFWLKFLEKGSGTVMAKYPAGSSAEAKARALEMAQAANEDTAFAIPDNAVLEVLDKVRQGGTDNFMTLADALCNNGIARRILGQTLTSKGSDGGGSRALGSVHMDVKQEKIQVDAKSLMGVINDQLMTWLMLFNAGPEVAVPRWTVEYQQQEDLKTRAERDKLLVEMGVPYPVSYAQYVYKIPEVEAGEAILAPQSKPGNPAEGGNPLAAPPSGGNRGENAPPGGTADGTKNMSFAELGSADAAHVPEDIRGGVMDAERLITASIQDAARRVYAPMLDRILAEAEQAVKKKPR